MEQAKNEEKRFYLLDNFRFIMIFCVVFAHCIECFANTQKITNYILFIIYIFHVPSLVFISGYFSISRTICFFPFFLLGYHLEKDNIKKIKSLNKKHIIIMVLIISISSIIIVKFELIPLYLQWFRGPFTNIWEGICSRFILIIMSLISILCFLYIIPNKKIGISYLGTKTLSIYVFHGLLLTIFQYILLKFYNITNINILLLILLSIIITLILSNDYLKKIITIIMIPINKTSKIKEHSL